MLHLSSIRLSGHMGPCCFVQLYFPGASEHCPAGLLFPCQAGDNLVTADGGRL